MGVRAPTSCTLKRGRLEWLGQGTQVRARWKQKCKATTQGTDLGAAGKVGEDMGRGGFLSASPHRPIVVKAVRRWVPWTSLHLLAGTGWGEVWTQGSWVGLILPFQTSC